MKTLALTALSITITVFALAQTNTFPPDGNVGVGTLSPEVGEGWHKVLEVQGTHHSRILVTTATEGLKTGLWSHLFGYYGAPAGGMVGTLSNHPFSILTNGMSRLTINPNGQVGIGTISPQYTLDVNGTGRFTNKLYVDNKIYFAGNDYDMAITANDGYGSSIISSPRQLVHIGQSSILFGTNNPGVNGYTLFMDNAKRVGVGTISPQYTLDVNGIARIGSSLTLNSDGGHGYIEHTGPSPLQIKAPNTYAWFANTAVTVDGKFRLGYMAYFPQNVWSTDPLNTDEKEPGSLFYSALTKRFRTWVPDGQGAFKNFLMEGDVTDTHLGNTNLVQTGGARTYNANYQALTFDSTTAFKISAATSNSPGAPKAAMRVGGSNNYWESISSSTHNNTHRISLTPTSSLLLTSYATTDPTYKSEIRLNQIGLSLYNTQGIYYLNNPISGSITDSLLTWEPYGGTGRIRKISISSLSTNTWQLGGNTGTSASTHYIGTNDAQPVVFKANGAEALRITTTGQVGIGTTNVHDYKLAVGGSMIAEKVKVKLQSAWPDYVFSNHYQLPSLKEVEQYIKQHQHLPEVPSAEQVKKEGIDLGDNQALLLKKIEELTLYIIEQNKQLEVLQKEVKALKEKQP